MKLHHKNLTTLTATGRVPTLQKAFNLVKDLNDWRNPIEAVIKRTDLVLVEKAIRFFCGDDTKILVLDGDATFDAAIFKYKRDETTKYVTVFTNGVI
jgi:hypothetical protein